MHYIMTPLGFIIQQDNHFLLPGESISSHEEWLNQRHALARKLSNEKADQAIKDSSKGYEGVFVLI